MSWPTKIIRLTLYFTFFFVPLIFLPNTSELFEFNKMIATYILCTIIAGAWITEILIEKKFVFRRSMLDLPIFIFLLIQFISLLLSLNIRTSMLGYYSRFNGGFVSLLCYSLLYWSFVTFMDSKSTLKAISVALWTAALVSAYGVLEHFGIDASMWVQDVQSRVFSTLGQPNWLAAYLAALLPLSISLALSSKNVYKKSVFGSLGLLFLVTIFYTKSQSGVGVTFVTLFIYLSLLLIQKRQIKIILAGLVAFVLLIALNFSYVTKSVTALSYIFTTQDVNSLTKQIYKTTVGGTPSTLIRRIVWQGGFDIWRSSVKTFWLGTGPETFTYAYYQHRPVAHNLTSEWELLYNKAHNEFVNYLATTGLLGLISYLVLLGFMLFIFIKTQKTNHLLLENLANQKLKNKNSPDLSVRDLLIPALMAGWISIPVTNFWGFSVVMVQILMFLLPAMALTLSIDPVFEKRKPVVLNPLQILGCLGIITLIGYFLFSIARYWTADTKYAAGQTGLRSFTASENPNYLLSAYQSYNEAYDLSPHEPSILSDLAVTDAYVSVLSQTTDATMSASVAQNALMLSQQAINENPYHPNLYKSRARVAIILSSLDSTYLDTAMTALQQAQIISPTDPRILFNMGVVASYQKNTNLAKKYLQDALNLKPDFADALVQLKELDKK